MGEAWPSGLRRSADGGMIGLHQKMKDELHTAISPSTSNTEDRGRIIICLLSPEAEGYAFELS